MLIALGLVVLAACAHTTGSAPQTASTVSAPSSRPHALLDRLVGRWVLTGTIAGQSTTHDVEASWVLQGNYVRLRETGDNGLPLYEATVFIGWLESANHYVCFWFDNTGVASGDVTCSAPDAQDVIAFEFRDAQGALTFTNTFLYHPDSDTWEWRLDNIRDNSAAPFARVSLRKQ
jgi:hypothetical protein